MQKARAICSQRASKERHRFLVGTCSLHDSNELSVLEYREDANQIDAVSLYQHPDQIWALASSPSDPSLVITSKQAADGLRGVTLWRMPRQTHQDMDDVGDGGGFGGAEALEEVARLVYIS